MLGSEVEDKTGLHLSPLSFLGEGGGGKISPTGSRREVISSATRNVADFRNGHLQESPVPSTPNSVILPDGRERLTGELEPHAFKLMYGDYSAFQSSLILSGGFPQKVNPPVSLYFLYIPPLVMDFALALVSSCPPCLLTSDTSFC